MNEQSQILSVSQLNRQIRMFLEHEVGDVRVEGEVSTLSKPASGHYYFTLKDSTAQVRCVFFRNRKTGDTDATLQAGQQIIASGQLSLYEARGDYQLIVERIESAGLGDLHRQFEQLKTKLAGLGLFDLARKKQLPPFPSTIGVITSSSGAALHDILTTLERRYPLARVLIYSSDVQGKLAPQQLIIALRRANQDKRADVLILARGGGSIEDLWGFNDEHLAYAIAESLIPIVSGVGHETDFTIADFVADRRAATPTAAAEAVSPNQMDLLALFQTLELRLIHAITKYIQHKQLLLNHELQKIASPEKLIRSYWQTLDYLQNHLQHGIEQQISQKQHQLQMLATRLNAVSPALRLHQKKLQLDYLQHQMIQQAKNHLQQERSRFETLIATLHAFSPLATLGRGYAIAMHGKKVLMDSHKVKPGEIINIKLDQGSLICEVTQHA